MDSPPTTLPLIGSRYLLNETIGRGGMGVVYRATDRLTGAIVALKHVTASGPDEKDSTGGSHSRTTATLPRLALAQEFQTLATLRHPHIISVLDYGFDEQQQPFFTMDYLAGASTLLKAGQGQPIQPQLDLLLQVLQALAYLHQRGILHRDLKPANILVHADERVKLLDFGLARLLAHPDPGDGTLAVGTFSYMAPEIMRGGSPAESSDLFAVGVIACELLGGQHPFGGGNVASLIARVLNEPPRLPVLGDQWNALLPVLGRLLDKQPAGRYASAGEVMSALCEATGRPLPPETAEIRESYLQTAPFTGRGTEMRTLGDGLQAALDRRGQAWLVGGESGVGKTRLLDELRIQALIRGVAVLRGQAAEGGSPYGLWAGIARWLCLLAPVGDQDAAVLKSIAPDVDRLLGRSVPDAPELEPEPAQTRLQAVVVRLLRQLDRPALLLLEDLQWASSQSLALTNYLAGSLAEMPLLLVGSFQTDATPRLHENLPSLRLLRLDRLDDQAIRSLSEAMLGGVGKRPDLLRLLRRETEGNAFFLVETIRALAEQSGGLGRVGQAVLPEHILAGGVRPVIQRRLDRVSPPDRPLLWLAAVAGRHLDARLLRHLVEHPPPGLKEPYPADLDAWLARCAVASVLEPHEQTWRFAHNLLRLALLESLPPVHRRRAHRALTGAIEAVYPEDATRYPALALHYREAGDRDREATYALKAAEEALRTSAYAEALAYLDRASALRRRAAPVIRGHIRRLQGRALRGLAEYRLARRRLQASLRCCQQADDQAGTAQAQLQLGELAETLGGYAAARRLYDSALALSKQCGDLACVAAVTFAWGRLAETVGELVPSLDIKRESLALYRQLGDQQGIANALQGIGSVYRRLGQYDQAEQYLRESLALHRQIGHRQGVAAALNNLGILGEFKGDFEAARRYHRESIAIKEEIGDKQGIAISWNNLGVISLLSKDYDAARTQFETSHALYESLGDRQGIADNLNNLGLLEYEVGDYAAAASHLKASLKACQDIGDQWGVALAHLNLGKVYRQQNRLAQARRAFHSAFEVALSIQKRPVLLQTLIEYATIIPDQADRLAYLLYAHEHPATPGSERERAAALLESITSQLPPEQVSAARARADRFVLEALVADLLAPARVKS